MADKIEQWTLAEAFLWVHCRSALRAEVWPVGAFLPPGWTAGIYDKATDEKVAESLNTVASAIKTAAAEGRLTIYGRRLRDPARPESVNDEPVEAIPPEVFSRQSIALLPGLGDDSGTVGPGDVEEGFGATANAADFLGSLRWVAITVAAAEVKRAWPADAGSCASWMATYAAQFLEQHRRPPSRDKEAVPDAQTAGFAINQARAAYAALPVHLRAANRKPRGASK